MTEVEEQIEEEDEEDEEEDEEIEETDGEEEETVMTPFLLNSLCIYKFFFCV